MHVFLYFSHFANQTCIFISSQITVNDSIITFPPKKTNPNAIYYLRILCLHFIGLPSFVRVRIFFCVMDSNTDYYSIIQTDAIHNNRSFDVKPNDYLYSLIYIRVVFILFATFFQLEYYKIIFRNVIFKFNCL